MPDATTPVAALTDAIVAFARARGWEPFHTPKNLTLALASEVGELCDIFRWLTPDEAAAAAADPAKREAIADELADIANIVLLLCHHTGVDLAGATAAKLVKNAAKYPAPGGAGDPG